MIDFQKINSAALTSLEGICCEYLAGGKRDGHEYVALNPRRGDRNLGSFRINLNSGAWCDFACGDDARGGDPVSLIAYVQNVGQGEAAKLLDERLRTGAVSGKAESMPGRPTSAAPDEWTPLPVAVVVGCPPPEEHYKLGKPSAVWEYRTPGGDLIGLICRFDTPEGKEIIPLSWCRHADGRERWRWKSFAKPRPLYNLPALYSRNTIGVILVEGEKTADAAAKLMPHCVVTTWAGGAKAIRHADFSPLKGRKVLIWPDADHAGLDAAVRIRSLLPESEIITPPDDWRDGYDLADALRDGWTTERVRAHIKARRSTPPPPVAQPPPEPTATPPQPQQTSSAGAEPRHGDERHGDAAASENGLPESDAPAPAEPLYEPPTTAVASDWPFRLLGYDNGDFYYLPDRAQQVVVLTANEHKRLPMLRLAPANWWEDNFPSKDGADYNASANALIGLNYREGIFEPRRVRGRGCWIDGQDVVFHAGDRLLARGVDHRIDIYPTKFIYSRSKRIETTDEPPATNAEAALLLKLCEFLPWKQGIFSKFLAGWCVVAPICGVLAWRPHIWITGPSGTGKTWILENIIDPLVGRTALQVQSATTEAGIRQTLRCDALPVIFDEAESEDRHGQQRIQKILELARQASSETGAGIIKGTAGGNAMEFSIRSCFCFASIGVAAVQRADTSRVTCLDLEKRGGDSGIQAFEILKAYASETIYMPGFAERIRARSLAQARQIRSNAQTFGAAVAAKLGDQRLGDQLGALLAGAFALTSPRVLELPEARAWVDKQDWAGFAPEAADHDEVRAYSVLVDALIRVDGAGAPFTVSVGELIVRAFSTEIEHTADALLARDTLLRHGIKVEPDAVSFSNSHAAIGKWFSDTAWSGKWKDQLGRMPGALHVNALRFGASVHRAVRLPKETFVATR